MSTLCASINKALNVASKPEAALSYGTAGFRSTPEDLRHAMIRCGILAVIRSRSHQGLPVGICVTASHNPAKDNGVKIVEPDGGMLVPEFEAYASEFVNSTTPFSTLEALTLSAIKLNLLTASEDCFKDCKVVLARDTRPSSWTLSELVKLGVTALGASVIDVGIATTPMLHWTVLTRHDDSEAPARKPADFARAYFDFWLEKAQTFLKLTPELDCNHTLSLTCDAASGVGGPAMEAFNPAFAVFNCEVEVRNREITEEVGLNDHCGAEHVQKTRQLPKRFGRAHGDAPGRACVALDGDADRVVFFTIPEEESGPLRTIIDGDRIAVVLSRAIMHLLSECVATGTENAKTSPTLSFGVVQTAYANGASTAYIRDVLETPAHGVSKSVVIAKTGVKNVHHEAVNFDIGIYFESNGHGTVTYKLDRILAWAQSWGIESGAAFQRLQAFLALVNDCVGDAIVDALVFVAAMRLLKLDFEAVLNIYQDLDVCQAKVAMSRSELDKLKSHPVHELYLVEPVELQNKINDIVSKFPLSRAFVRASGTEDACRIYVEAPSHDSAKQILDSISTLLETIN